MRNVLVAVMVAAALTLPAQARASTISYSTSFSTIIDTLGSEVGPSFFVPLSDLRLESLPRFNLAGTLQSVQMTLASSYYSSVYGFARDDRGIFDSVPFPPFVINQRNDTFVTVGLLGSLRIQLLNPSGFVGTTSIPSLAAECEEHHSSTNGLDCSDSQIGSGFWNRDLPVGALGLAPFVGIDDMTLAFLSTGTMFGTCDEDAGDDFDDFCFARTQLYWSGDVTVTYTFAPAGPGDPTDGGDGAAAVPEPSTLVLLGIGLVALSRRLVRARAR